MFEKLFGKKDKTPAQVTVDPAGVTFTVDKKQTILDAALMQGIDFPHNCRAGGCGTCKCRLQAGKVKELTDKSYVLSADELAAGYILGCQSVPRGDVTVAVEGLLGAGPEHALVETPATIADLQPLTHDIVELRLHLDRPIRYTAGQYAELRVPGVIDAPRSYSFAAAPPADGTPVAEVVFHVRKVPGGAFTPWLHGQAHVGERVQLAGPYGNFWLRPGDAPLLCIAGGSGMAPIKALLEAAKAAAESREVVYLFGARTQADLYMVDAMQALARSWRTQMRFVPVLSDEPADSDWTGARGMVTDLLAEFGPELSRYHAYLCGPPPMIDAAVEKLTSADVDEQRIYFDKFLDRSHTQPEAA